jgi:hypothetical protein
MPDGLGRDGRQQRHVITRFNSLPAGTPAGKALEVNLPDVVFPPGV